jgi:leader peptidase (prepilin peptidase)/N-methyltransferase
VVVAGTVIACAVSVAMVAVLGWSRELWVLWLPGLLGVGLAIVDVRQRRLPFLMTGAMYALSGPALVVVAVISGDPAPVIRALVAGIAAIGVFLAVAMALPGQLGLGDVVLIGWIALTLGWLGWGRLGVGLLAGLLVQAATAATLMALRRRCVDGGLPMGPALLAGWLVGVVGFMTR